MEAKPIHFLLVAVVITAAAAAITSAHYVTTHHKPGPRLPVYEQTGDDDSIPMLAAEDGGLVRPLLRARPASPKTFAVADALIDAKGATSTASSLGH